MRCLPNFHNHLMWNDSISNLFRSDFIKKALGRQDVWIFEALFFLISPSAFYVSQEKFVNNSQLVFQLLGSCYIYACLDFLYDFLFNSILQRDDFCSSNAFLFMIISGSLSNKFARANNAKTFLPFKIINGHCRHHSDNIG